MTDKDKLKELLRKFRDDPVFFVEKMFKVSPTEQQKELLRAVAAPGAKVSVRSGHGTGKSTALAWLVLWFLITHPNCKVPCTAPSAHQLQDVLWAEIAKWRNKMPDWFREQVIVKSDRVEIKGAEETQFAVARTARRENPDALQGFHADNLLFIIDEASGVDEKVFEVARGALSTPLARVVMCANPTQLTGYFYASHHKNRDNWTRLQFSCLDSPLVDPSYVQDVAREYGEDSDVYRVRVLGEFPRASIVQLIPLDLVERRMGKYLRQDQYGHAPKILGVDVAWYGDDRSAVFLRQGLMSKLLGTWCGIDNMTLAGLVAQYEDEYKTDAIFIDVGWGTGVIDRLKQMGRNPIAVNFGGAATNEKYANKRTEMWCLMKEWLEQGGVLPDNSDLRDDLIGPQYSFTTTGKIQLERKEDMKKRGLASPDLADALALTFAYPVMPKATLAGHQQNGLYFAQTKYDLFGRS